MRRRVGIISDTHGLLRPEAVAALRGCDEIIHAGDVGPETILTELRRIAPVTAIRGNVDRAPWTEILPLEVRLPVAGKLIYVVHDLNALVFDPVTEGFDVIISGHSHQPKVEHRNGVIYVNPGSAGRRRFSLPVTLARLEITGRRVAAELFHLL